MDSSPTQPSVTLKHDRNWWKLGFFVILILALSVTGWMLFSWASWQNYATLLEQRVNQETVPESKTSPTPVVSSTFEAKTVTNHIILSYPDNWFFVPFETGAFISSIPEECPQCSQAEIDNSFYFKITDDGALSKGASENAQYFKLNEWLDYFDSESQRCLGYPAGGCPPSAPGYVEYYLSAADDLFPQNISAVEIGGLPRTGLNRDVSSERIYLLIANKRMVKVDIIYPKRFDVDGKLEKIPYPLDEIITRLEIK